MSIPVHCKQCGYRGIAHSISVSNSTGITFEGGSENCVRCGGRAEFQSGTYDFVGDMISAFRVPGVTRQKIAEVQSIVSKALDGTISAADAVKQTQDVDSAIGGVLRAAHDHGISFDRIMMIIALLYAFYADYSSDKAAQVALAEAKKQTVVAERMLEALEGHSRLRVKAGKSAKEVQTKGKVPQMTSGRNRHERRKSNALQRRSREGS